MSIEQNLKSILSELTEDITLVAVSKTKPVSDLMQAYNAGQRVFGENKIQEMVDKQAQMPKDIEWHMIGHVQRNKVKYMAEFVSLIHGVDSLKLLKEINKQALKHDRIIDCLLQIKIADEDSKFGMSSNDAIELLSSETFSELKNICVTGVMGMATFTSDTDKITTEFKRLKQSFDNLKSYQSDNCNLSTVSME